ncbi:MULTISPECIES: PucR family transcriptional regulator [unclassified Microbacterium]|uniref:PucR family transcriptional regulator n=1 Tax=unclassified Microbacterium TaxID=2609290 RepID=UPI0034656EC5
MPTVRELVVMTESHSVRLLAPTAPMNLSGQDVERIVILQSLAALQTVPQNSVVVVPEGLFTRQDSSGLDMLLRRVSERGVLAVLIQGLVQVQPRLQRLTDRFRVAVLGCPAEVDLGDLVTSMNYSVSGGPASTLLRVSVALDRIREWTDEGAGDDFGRLVTEVSAILGEEVSFDRDVALGSPVIVNGVVMGHIGTRNDSVPTVEVQLVLPALSHAIGFRLALANQQEKAMEDERSRALTALIVADSASVDHYASVARRLGVDVDGFHVALVVTSESVDPVLRDAEYRQVQTALARATVELPVELAPTRFEARFGALISSRSNHGLSSVEARAALQSAIGAARSSALFWGIGTEHVGPAGIRTSMYEATSASNNAAAERVTHRIVPFDASGVQRLISEMRASVTAGRVAIEILEPLKGLGNRDTSLETLSAWLDERGSLKAVAERLHLHPNAVAYRMAKIAQALDLDLADSDNRFALHLACRILLGS